MLHLLHCAVSYPAGSQGRPSICKLLPMLLLLPAMLHLLHGIMSSPTGRID